MSEAPAEKLLLSASETALALGISRSAFYGLLSSGRIPEPIRLGRRTLWSVAELRRWIQAGARAGKNGSRFGVRRMATEKQIESLETQVDKFKVRKYHKFFVERELLFSKAFWSLPADAIRVYLVFLNKCVVRRPSASKEKRKYGFIVVNNGEIQFTYKEAREKFSITDKQFGRTIDRLVESGFIDIGQQGDGMHRVPTLYAVSERWKLFGTDEFKPATRVKRKVHYGFCRPKKKHFQQTKMTVAQQTKMSAVEKNDLVF